MATTKPKLSAGKPAKSPPKAEKAPAPPVDAHALPAVEFAASFDLTSITFNPDNPRTITADKRAALGRSLDRFGMVDALVVNRRKDGSLRLVGGEQRLRALRDRGVTTGPVSFVRLNEQDEKALGLVLNGHSGDWNMPALDQVLKELHALGEPIADLGIDPKAVDNALRGLANITGGDSDEDAAAKFYERGNVVSERGKVYELGPHRVYCGDSRSDAEVGKMLGKDRPPLLLTDPPYCSGGFQEAGRAAGTFGDIAADNLSTRGFIALMKDVLAVARAKAAYLFTDWRQYIALHDLTEASGLPVRSMIVWDKGTPGLGGIWRTQHEIIVFASRNGAKRTKGQAALGNVIRSNRSGNDNHYTEKPVDLIEKILANDEASDRGNCSVFDPFLGSGTTLIAASRRKRTCFGCEVEPRFVDVIRLRWTKYARENSIDPGPGALDS